MPIPNAKYEIPVLEALVELGGKASVQAVYPVVERIMLSQLKQEAGEYGSHKSSREPIWHNKTRWAREALKKKGELLGNEFAIWKITEIGRERLHLLKETGGDPDEDIIENGKAQVLTGDTDFSSTSEVSVSEGRRLLRYHYIRERNPKIIRIAKKNALKKFGELRCEVCDFSFREKYGERAAHYIEGHHKASVRHMSGSQKTKVEDIALLCSNCHRAIHTKYPYISVEELGRIVKLNLGD